MGKTLRSVRPDGSFPTPTRIRAVKRLLGTSGALLGSTLLASPAIANCTLISSHIVCDGSSGPMPLTGAGGYESVTLLNGQTTAHNFGLILQSLSYPNVNFAMDATSTPTPGGVGSLRLLAERNITTTTPYHTGINGNLITSADIALQAVTYGGGTVNILQGTTSTITGKTGIDITTGGGDNANVILVANGRIDSELTGIRVNAMGTSSITTSGDVTGGQSLGIDSSSAGANTITVSGWTRGRSGVQAVSWISDAQVNVTESGMITGQGGVGLYVKADRQVRLSNSGTIAGATDGVIVESGLNAADYTEVAGAGSIAAAAGNGIKVSNSGRFATIVSQFGSVDAGGGNGVQVNNTGSGTNDIWILTRAVTASATGISAEISNAASTGLIFVDATRDLTATSGIVASNAGSGNIFVDVAGAMRTQTSGISAALGIVPGQSNSISIDVKTGSSITAAASGSTGIQTNIGQSSGNSTVYVRGAVTGTEAIRQIAVTGKNDTTNVVTGQIDATTGIVQTNANGLNTVTNDGVIRATALAISQTSSANGNAQVVNKGTISGGYAINAALTGGAYLLRNELGGLLNGAVLVAGSNGAASTFSNAGSWNAIGVSGFSGSITNTGLVNVAAGDSIASSAGMMNAATGTLAFAGNGQIGGNLTNAGLITLANQQAGQVATLSGNFTGLSGSVIQLDVSLANQQADLLAITGGASGSAMVLVNILDRGTLTNGFLPLVTVAGGAIDLAPTSTNLSSSGFLIQKLGWHPADSRQFGITQTVNPASIQVAQLSGLGASLSNLIDEPLGESIVARSSRFGIWGRGSVGDINQSFRSNSMASAADGGQTRTSYSILQAGLDYALIAAEQLAVNLGMTSGRYDASSRVAGGRTDTDGKFIGGYLAISGHGLQIDATFRGEWREHVITNALLVPGKTIKAKGMAKAGGANASYRLALGSIFVKPAVGYSFGSTDLDPFALDERSVVLPGNDKTGQVRFGGTLGWSGQVGKDLVLAPYVGLFGIENTARIEDTEVRVGKAPFAIRTESFRNTLQVVGGIDLGDLSGKLSVFTRASLHTSNGVDGASFRIGARLNF